MFANDAQLGADVDISLSGRRPEAFHKAVKARPELKAARFRQCDIDDAKSLAEALKVRLCEESECSSAISVNASELEQGKVSFGHTTSCVEGKHIPASHARRCSWLQDVDLLVHAAGPFQRRTECNVLEACIAAGVPYMDVCDDADYTQRAKGLHQR